MFVLVSYSHTLPVTKKLQHSSEWLKSLTLHPSPFRPCLLSLGPLNFLPILLTDRPKTHAWSPSLCSWPFPTSLAALFTRRFNNVHLISERGGSTCWVTTPQSARKITVCSTCRATCNLLTGCVHMHPCVCVCVCVHAGVGGVYRDTVESFTRAG